MKVKFKDINKSDIEFLYDLLQERTLYPKPIRYKKSEILSYVDHKKFVMKHLKGDGYLMWKIIMLNNIKVGSLVLKKDGEWGYHILMKYWGKRLGQSALSFLIKQYPNMTLKATIKPGNKIAQHIAQKFGHELKELVFIRNPKRRIRHPA